MNRHSALALALGLFAPALFAADWPQWQGPNRDNISPEKGLLQKWPKNGPKLLWTFKNTGAGYSGPAIVGDRLYILGARDKTEYLLALDVKEGKELWKAKIGPSYTFQGNQYGDGPRATPSVANGHVYALGGYGDLICVEADGGKEQWRVSMTTDLNGQVKAGDVGPAGIGCGFTWSPLVDGDQLVVFPGGPKGAVAALDLKNKGKVLWRSSELKEQCSYASPIAATIEGVRQYIVVFSVGLAGVEAKTGDVLWQYPKRPPASADFTICTPLYHEGHVYVSLGGAGCDKVKLEKKGAKFSAKKVFSNKIMKNDLGGYALVDGNVYGYSNQRGWTCQDFEKGKEVWSEKGTLDAGSLIYADGHLYCYDEDSGIVVLAEASPKEWSEKGRFEIPQHGTKEPKGRHWTHPVIANGCLYLRDQELLFCYKIK